MATASQGHPNLPMYLSNLGTALARRFEHAGDSADLDSAIDAGQQAVDAAPPGYPNLPMLLSNLGTTLASRFKRAGDSADLDDSIDFARQAVTATPPGNPNLPMYLSNLGISLRLRFEHAGDNGDLDDAIDATQQAVDATLPGHPNRAAMLSNLGTSLWTRFERSGDSADLDHAIDAGRQAVDATPPGHPNLPMYLSNLGNSLRLRFEYARGSADLDDSIDAGRRAVAATVPGHADHALRLSNLGISLYARFKQAGDSADLDAAIDFVRQAVTATPPGHSKLPMYLSNLGNSLLTRFGQTGDSGDLDAGIDAGRRAVDAAPPSHASLARYQLNLGRYLLIRFKQTEDSGDLDAAIGYFRAASQIPTGTASERLSAARSWGFAAARAGRWHQAAEGYAAAVALLPMVAWHGLDRATREEQLAQWAGLATDAAACAIRDGRPELAVELLEQGRSVLWTEALNLRSDLTRLVEEHPVLAERLDRIRAVLDSPVTEAVASLSDPRAGSAPAAGHAQQDAAGLRRRKAREWDQALAEVRALNGFEHFLARIMYPGLVSAAADDPVVIVNVSRHGCHALIVDVSSEHAQVVNLPGMSLDAAVDHANEMLLAVAGSTASGRAFPRKKDRHVVLDNLEWLWDVVAEPVLTALGHTSRPEADSPWPRVLWCPTGPLTALPIHAAGHHPRLRTATADSTDCVLDRVISSYTTTLTALTRSRQPLARSPVRQLTVGMAITPGLPPLPAVPTEMKVLARHFTPSELNHQLVGSQATQAAVLSAMATHSLVHLACHASQQHADPTSSGFALWDGRLTITDLAGQPTQRRDLAFLSACQTATGSVRNLDEAIHLAAAMQFLGYRHVIATLWTIADSPAPEVADNVYKTLSQSGTPDPDRTGEALHQAIHSLRQADPTNPLLWAPYIHLGN